MTDTTDWNAKTIAEFRANEGRVGGPFEGAPIVLVHHRGRTSAREIFPILAASGVRSERRRGKRDGIANPVAAHLADGVSQHRMPVAIAPVNRDVDDFFQCRNQCPVLVVKRAAADEVVIMFGNFKHPFARNIASTQTIF